MNGRFAPSIHTHTHTHYVRVLRIHALGAYANLLTSRKKIDQWSIIIIYTVKNREKNNTKVVKYTVFFLENEREKQTIIRLWLNSMLTTCESMNFWRMEIECCPNFRSEQIKTRSTRQRPQYKWWKTLLIFAYNLSVFHFVLVLFVCFFLCTFVVWLANFLCTLSSSFKFSIKAKPSDKTALRTQL